MGHPKIAPKPAEREDVHTTTSQIPGLKGYLETWLRRFRTAAFLLLISPLALVLCLCMGIAMAPGLFLFDLAQTISLGWIAPLRYAAMGIGLAAGFFTYGLTLIFVIPLVNFVIPLRVKPFRGPWFSLPAIPWYIHNGLTYLVRYTFLELVTPTPLNILFYRMMGMKIGKGVVINSTNISDPCLITLGDYVTIGGSATIFAHYGQKGYLVIAPVYIGKGTNVGLKASVMGGADIGQNVVIKPHTVILPKTVIPPGEIV
ncbi:MAG: hypothetical protein AB7G93_05315 [Bdellovibrionales bacterium]